MGRKKGQYKKQSIVAFWAAQWFEIAFREVSGRAQCHTD